MNEDTLKICEEALRLARRMIEERDEARDERDAALREVEELKASEETALEAYKIVSNKRDDLTRQVRDLSDKLADAEAKIENFQRALDTETRR